MRAVYECNRYTQCIVLGICSVTSSLWITVWQVTHILTLEGIFTSVLMLEGFVIGLGLITGLGFGFGFGLVGREVANKKISLF